MYWDKARLKSIYFIIFEAPSHVYEASPSPCIWYNQTYAQAQTNYKSKDIRIETQLAEHQVDEPPWLITSPKSKINLQAAKIEQVLDETDLH